MIWTLHLLTLAQAESYSTFGEPISPLPNIEVNVQDPKVALGFELFIDKRLSKDNTISCSSCHKLSKYGMDNLPKSVGILKLSGDVNAPTIYNSVYNFRQFWDGRAKNLEEQVSGPIAHPKEMGSSWEEVTRKVSNTPSYVEKFKRVYGAPVSTETITNAIVTFEKTLTTPNSRFDRFLRGETSAISQTEKKGYEYFKSYGCISCHQGVNVGGNMYQNMGVMGQYFKDRGRSIASADYGRFNVTQQKRDKFLFKVPSLRNVAETAPYFHDGSVADLDDAVRTMAKYQLGRDLKDDEIRAIVSFLKTLTGPIPRHVQSLQVQVSGK